MCCISKHTKELREILLIKEKDEREKKLVELAKKVGASTVYWFPGLDKLVQPPEFELVARIREAQRTWSAVLSGVGAIVSAVIALLSAIAAWLAVVYN
jgi:hypothetical protein